MSGRGKSDIPALRLEVLKEFVTQFNSPPNLVLNAMFGGSPIQEISDSIQWESQRGGRGMVPFVPPGAPAPRSAPHGIAQHSATAAYWKEKRYFDEEFLNNLRKPGTYAEHHRATDILAENMSQLVNRANRRKEWMFAKMMFDGGFTYYTKGGYMVELDYGLPDENVVTLAGNYRWGESSAAILTDIKNGKRTIAEGCGGKIDVAMCTSRVLDLIGSDSTIQGFLETRKFGDGRFMQDSGVNNLALVNPVVVASLFDIPNLIIYDEMFEIQAHLTANITAGSTTTLTVNDASDFEAAGTLTVWKAGTDTHEKRNVVSVNHANNTVKVAYGFDNSYQAGVDFVTAQRYILPEDKFVMISSTVDGKPIAKYHEAPFGLGRHWGLYTDTKEEWDPEGVYIRVQDKGLPVLYQRDAVYVIDVGDSRADAATTTTTTTTTSSTTSSTTTTP